jgi:hypothetical protein
LMAVALACPASVSSGGAPALVLLLLLLDTLPPVELPTSPPKRKHQDRAESRQATGASREILPHREHLSPTAPLTTGEGRQELEQACGTVSIGVETAPVLSSSWGGTRRAGLEPRRVCEEGPHHGATRCWWRRGRRSSIVG